MFIRFDRIINATANHPANLRPYLTHRLVVIACEFPRSDTVLDGDGRTQGHISRRLPRFAMHRSVKKITMLNGIRDSMLFCVTFNHIDASHIQ